MNQVQGLKFNRSKLMYLIVAAILLYILIKYKVVFGTIFKPFFYAIIFAYLLDPIVDVIEGKKIKRVYAVILVYLILICFIIFFSFVIAPRLFKDIKVLVESIPRYTAQFQHMIKGFQESYMNSNLPQGLKEIIDNNLLSLQDWIVNGLQTAMDGVLEAFSKFIYFILVPVIVFYLLKDASYFKKQIMLLLPRKHRNKAVLLFRDIDNVFGRYIRGQIIVAIFVGVMITTALTVLKIKYAVFLGLFSGLVNIIPYFGPIIGLIPTVMFALFDSPAKALYAAGAFIIIQQIESGILTPRIIGHSVGVHPVYVILSLVIGGKFFGIGGMIIAVPILAAIKLTMSHMLRYIKHERNV